MADVNVNAPADQAPTMAPPTRTDDQILPHIRRVPLGKSNWYLDVERSQSNPIYKIAVNILKHTNFFRAFTASSTIPSVDIQQFWDTVRYDKTVGCYKCQLDEQWFNLTKNTLRDAIQITPVDNNNAFSSPLTLDTLINFVNDMGYPKVVRNLSNFVTNDMFQPWRALTTIINLCLTGKTLGFDRPRAPVLQILWSSKQKFHLRLDSPLHLPNEEPILGYIKFSAKGTKREVFGMPIPNKLITANIQGIPEKEPRFDDEEADVQRALEESLKNVYDAPRGLLLPVVISEPDSGKYQPLPEKKSPAEQFIFQRRTSTPTESSGYDVSSSLYVELGLTDSEVKSNEDVPGIDAGVQDEGQAGPNLGEQDEGQAGPNLGEQDEGQAGPNPGDAATSQPQSSPVVHVGPNLEHTDLEATDVSTQPRPKQMDEGFTATAYPNVHENLKLTVEEQVILEEPASSTGTLSSLQHLPKDLNFGDLFFNDKPSEADNEKSNAETKAESMMFVTIQQDTSAIPPMTTPIINLTSRPDSLNVSKPVDKIVTDAVDWAIQALLRNRFRDFPEADMKEILHQRIWETNSYKAHEDHMMLYEALEKSMNRDHTDELLKNLAEPPPPLPLSTYQAGQSHGSAAPSSSKTVASAEYKAWTMTDTRLRPSISSTPEDLHMDDDMAPDAQVHSSDDEVIGNAHIPKASALASTYSPSPEDSLLAQTGLAFKLVKVFHPNVIHLWYQMEECHKLLIDSLDDSILQHNVSKPLPLGGPPGQVTIQSDFFFNKDLKYLRYGSKGSRPALSVSKMKANYYPDVGLEQMVPDQMWIEEECKFDIAAMYETWFQLGIESYQTQLNLTKPRWDATGFEYKHNYKVIDSPRAVTFRDKYEVQMIMRFNEIHNFNDDTLHQIDEAFDYRVKEFKVNRMNPGLNTRFWIRKDVDRSKEFMFAIQKRLKTRWIFRNLESFVGGRYQMEECHKLLNDSVDDSIIMHNVSKPLPLGGPPGQTCTVNIEDEGAYYPDVGLEQMVPDQMRIEEECKYDIAAMYDESRFEHKVLDEERCGSKQGINVRHSETAKDKEDLS
nr:hypothetical protein [Tanacetum cinerariifolium]